ncbi:hypothetical protein A3G56_01300 [Candidatus Falkowbacteria bacterium RIFCSPLOWO2_12_FULL_45_10]|uniref:DUF1573 domain-containing protein n=2 Tax=Candidatus Falkowiibacteriota TaxID=1752728 RepID=A0A1F5RZS1_9BACT|nr:MAG: hypothetical protein A3G56_01300 [Candidatus Falkowbacteria bacterium RIFCSPLOWO2_12_FULL_45_10]OGF19997.1 MAG: hypothetical protein A3I35_01055 [Candidatus Falkowbacteria bacterium RIFCSPLOWO2_02_FULL_45_15]
MKTKQFNYLICGIAAVVLVAVGWYFLNQTISRPALAEGRLEITESDYDFGVVGLAPVNHIYRVKNAGAGDITIVKVATSCGCTTAQLRQGKRITPPIGMDHGNLPRVNFVLGAGEEMEVVAAYNPLAHGPENAAGFFQRAIYLKTENPRAEYTLTFNVTVDTNK